MNMDNYCKPIERFAVTEPSDDWIVRASNDKVSLVVLEDRAEVRRPLMKWLSDDDIIVNNNRGYNILSEKSFDDWFYDKTANRLGIVDKESNKLVGFLGMEYSPNDLAAEYSITIGDANDRGRGIGTEATKLALRICFEELNAQSCHLFVWTENAQAIRCYEKAGFMNNGLYRGWGKFKGARLDWYFMDIVYDEYVHLYRQD